MLYITIIVFIIIARRSYDRNLDSGGDETKRYGYPTNAGLDSRRRARANYAWQHAGRHHAQARQRTHSQHYTSNYANTNAKSHAWWSEIVS